MAQENGNPGCAGGRTGAETKKEAGSFNSQDSKSARKSNRTIANRRGGTTALQLLRITRLMHRLGLTYSQAAALAGLAFGEARE